MSTEPGIPISVFIFYANEDKNLHEKLESHLSSLKKQLNKISSWHDRNISPGQEWAKEINAYLNTADLILLLISPDFIDSNDCYNVMLLALKRHEAHEVRVIPIILRPGEYKDEPFSKLQALPANDKAITSWTNTDQVLYDVANGVGKVVEELLGSGGAAQKHNQTDKIFQSGSRPTRDLPPLTDNPTPEGSWFPPLVSVDIGSQPPIKPNSGRHCRVTASIMIALVLLLILASSVIAFVTYISSQPTIVTIIPESKTLNASYLITAVTSTPDAKLRQVQARQLSYTTPPQSKTVNATGKVQRSGFQATGMLTFYNGKTVPQTIAAETAFTDSQGVQIVNDAVVNIPAAHPPTEGQVTVTAHAVNAGLSGNIAALDINGECCTSDDTIFVKNFSPFTGGKDPVGYTFVQQSDIDGATNSLEQSLRSTVLSSLQSQVDTKEEFVAPPRCTNKLSSDHNAGDKASSVKVTVVATCTGEVYDRQGAEKVAADLLKQEEVQNFSASYALVGTIATVVVKVTVVNADKGTVSLQVKARGLWVYQFDATQKQRLTKLIVGKTAQDAIKVLKKQDGVSKIQISGDVGTLPTDPTKIIIKIGSV